jgi:hypothetical protein
VTRRSRTCHVCRREFHSEALFIEHRCGELVCPRCGERITVRVRAVDAWCDPCGADLVPGDKSAGQRVADFALRPAPGLNAGTWTGGPGNRVEAAGALS